MKREDALKRFLKEEANDASLKFVLEAMTCLDKVHKKDTTMWFCSEIRQMLRQAPELYFLQIVLVRSKALIQQPFYRLAAYPADLYLSEPIYQKELEFDWLYQSYARFSDTLETECRKYIGKIGKAELNRIKLAELYTCQKLMKHMFMETVVHLLRSEEYKDLNPDKNVQFHVGEYQGPYEILMTKDKKMAEMGGWLCEFLQTEGA